MKLFTKAQIKELDIYTIEHEPIKAIDLMERASVAVCNAIMQEWGKETPVVVFAGPGNNGGDALAVARLLTEHGYNVNVYLFNIHNKLSDECAINKRRFMDLKHSKTFIEVTIDFDPPRLDKGTLVVDGLFGYGLTKSLAGGFASLVKYINQSQATVVSIDMPSGLMTEDNSMNVRANIIRADLTLTIGQKKISMFMADNQQFIGRLKVLDINHSREYIERAKANFHLLEDDDARNLLKPRDTFAHKGMMGNALIVAGSYGMAGAAILATRACMRAGSGKTTIVTPRRNYNILQTAVPEALVETDDNDSYFSEAIDVSDADAVAIGPGIGIQESTAIAMIAQIRRTQSPLVVDADAINILANHRAWTQQLPKKIILTPHPREFDRLAGVTCNDCYERLQSARDLAEKLEAYIILKGHYSALCMPDGTVVFNSTGNAGMATAGSGDVLTGIITALCARGYNQAHACMLGMYLHGLAGDLAAKEIGEESLIASDIIDYLPKAFQYLENK